MTREERTRVKTYYDREQYSKSNLNKNMPGLFDGTVEIFNPIRDIVKALSNTALKDLRIDNDKLKEIWETNQMTTFSKKISKEMYLNEEVFVEVILTPDEQIRYILHNVDDVESKRRLDLLAGYLDISELLNKFPSQMSGGQRQRVAAARALILDPKIVFADEPTGALDSKNANILMQKLSAMNEMENTTILMVTHDSVAASFCNRILFIQDGKLFHEIRRDYPRETQQDFYQRVLKVMSTLAGGDQNVF